MNIEEVKEFYYKLVDNGYVEIDECLIYYDYREEVANMWIEGTSLSFAAKQYIQDNSYWYEALEMEEPQKGYIDSNDTQIYYCMSKGCDI